MSSAESTSNPIRRLGAHLYVRHFTRGAVLGSSLLCACCSPSVDAAIVEPGGRIVVAPVVTPHVGPEDDFDPERCERAFVLANDTDQPLEWMIDTTRPWLKPQHPTHGVLAPGDSATVSVIVDPSLAVWEKEEPSVAELVFQTPGALAPIASSPVSVGAAFAGDDGWTDFPASADSRSVYISSTLGVDSNDGLTPTTPRRTIAAGRSLLRQGFPDRLLLRRGDVWHENLGHWTLSGRSADEPLLVSTWGDAPERPLLLTGSESGIWTNGGGGSPPTIDHLAIIGLHFRPHTYTGASDCIGAKFLQPGTGILIEDCAFEGYSSNLVFQGFGGRHTDFKLRRSIIVDAYATNVHSQGLYAYGVDGLLIEENVFDHNGWNESVSGAHADIFSHNLYIDNGNTGVVVRGNIIARGSSHGMQLRPGGSVVNNLFVRNAIALSLGGGSNPEPAGVSVEVRGNVVLEGRDIDQNNPRGWALWFGNIVSGVAEHNLIANNTLGSSPSPLTIDGKFKGETGPTIGVHDLTIVDNIVSDWGGSITSVGDTATVTGVQFEDNDVQCGSWTTPLVEHAAGIDATVFHSSGNRFHSELLGPQDWTRISAVPHPLADWFALVGDGTSAALEVAYDDPKRSLSDYNELIGGATGVEAFLAEARRQSRTNWRPSYMAVRANRFIRGGF